MILLFYNPSKVLLTLQKQIKAYLFNFHSKLLPLAIWSLFFLVGPLLLQRIIPTHDQFPKSEIFSELLWKNVIFNISVTIANVSTVIVYGICMYFVYVGEYVSLERYRVEKETKWPWETNKQKWSTLLNKTIRCLLMNNLIYLPLTMSFLYAIRPGKILIETNPQLASPYPIMISQILLFAIIQDLLSTLFHYLMHSPFLYWVHKRHHEYNITVAITAEYTHPVEFVFANSIATASGFMLLAPYYDVNIVTVIMWIILRVVMASDIHSGYDWPWGFEKLLPFSASADYHDFHHSHNVGNLGISFTFFETLIGTNQQYFSYLQKKKHKRLEMKKK